ncbi:MAG: cytochrome c [Planctomycetota bacterium]|nr:cytochrome c [Planctomycetota bacterium]
MLTTARLLVPAFVIALLAGCGEPSSSDLPDEDVVPKATVARGGLLYDKFWKASAAGEPTETHPLWEKRTDTTSNDRTGSTTWRCKECHGWDYKGVDGAYAQGSHRTGFGGVLGTKLSAAELTESIAETHGYRAAGLSDTEIESLVLFMQEGLVDTAASIDDEGAFKGDAKRGKRLYNKGLGGSKSCSTCHGVDGLRRPDTAPKDYDEWVGKIAQKNPWEFLHKVRFGHPGSVMPSAVGAKVPMKDIVDVAAFSQTLPKSR